MTRNIILNIRESLNFSNPYDLNEMTRNIIRKVTKRKHFIYSNIWVTYYDVDYIPKIDLRGIVVIIR